jgi:uncharacterized protein YndB with AHSA1/START domain
MVPDGMNSEIHLFDGREGGTFRISLTHQDPTQTGKTIGATDTFQGRFVKIAPDAEIVQVVEFRSDDPAMRGEMTITYLLEDRDGGTDVTGIHDDLPPGLSSADNELGWSMSMAKLAKLVEENKGEDDA